MNEQLQIELTKVVTKINNGTDSAWGFLQAQTPDVIQQLLVWHGVKSFLSFCIAAIFIIAGFVVVQKLFKRSKGLSDKSKEYWKDKQYNHYDSTPFIAMWAIPLGICIIAIPISIFENLTWLKIWLAPKVWILEYIKSLAS